MNYFPFHIGDWIKKTAGLTNNERAMYLALLIHYYATEQPLADDMAALARITNIVRRGNGPLIKLLDLFFERTPEGWRNKRADEEIAAFHAREAQAAKRLEDAARRQAMFRARELAADYRVPATEGKPLSYTGLKEPTALAPEAPAVDGNDPANDDMLNDCIAAADELQSGDDPRQSGQAESNALKSRDVRITFEAPITKGIEYREPEGFHLEIQRGVLALQAMGFMSASMSDPALIEAMKSGASPADVAKAAAEAKARGKPLSWALATAQGRALDDHG